MEESNNSQKVANLADKSLLIVDDDNPLRDRLSRAMEKKGFKVTQAEEGTKIKAMLDGIVTLAEPDLFYTGGTLIFDHGHGVSTLYMHMKKILVKNGQKVTQGDIIGTVGATGRATGAHLDVRLNWFQTRLDPATALPK